VQQLKADVQNNIEAWEQTRKQINDMYATAKIGLILGTVLIVLIFILTALSFYRQLRE
jgi:cell division septal protein FtsQ